MQFRNPYPVRPQLIHKRIKPLDLLSRKRHIFFLQTIRTGQMRKHPADIDMLQFKHPLHPIRLPRRLSKPVHTSINLNMRPDPHALPVQLLRIRTIDQRLHEIIFLQFRRTNDIRKT